MKRFYTAKSSDKKTEYDIWIDTETGDWNCTCLHGTIGRWKKGMEKYCKHVKKVIDNECKK